MLAVDVIIAGEILCSEIGSLLLLVEELRNSL